MATKQEVAADAMIAMAADGNIGYSQGAARTGLRGHTPAEVRAGLVADTDCSFSVAWALWVAGFIPESVLYGTIYTGNQASVYAQYGATNYSWDSIGINGLRVGDVLLSNGHTAMVVPYGSGLGIAEASLNEFGDILGGRLGDQTGGETTVGPLRRGKWHTVQRWPSTTSSKTVGNTEEEELMAAKDDIIKALREDLAYQNKLIAQLRSDVGSTQRQLEKVRAQLHYDAGRTQTMVKNVADGLAYINRTYLDPVKQAVARLDKTK